SRSTPVPTRPAVRGVLSLRKPAPSSRCRSVSACPFSEENAMQLASRFASGSPMLRSDHPLSDDQIRAVVPSIFAAEAHHSRSRRYSYIPTAAVLAELRREGVQPFIVWHARVRQQARRVHARHVLRPRHASQMSGDEASEIILRSSHAGSSSYQMLAGMFGFVCGNGLVCGDTL